MSMCWQTPKTCRHQPRSHGLFPKYRASATPQMFLNLNFTPEFSHPCANPKTLDPHFVGSFRFNSMVQILPCKAIQCPSGLINYLWMVWSSPVFYRLCVRKLTDTKVTRSGISWAPRASGERGPQHTLTWALKERSECPRAPPSVASRVARRQWGSGVRKEIKILIYCFTLL